MEKKKCFASEDWQRGAEKRHGLGVSCWSFVKINSKERAGEGTGSHICEGLRSEYIEAGGTVNTQRAYQSLVVIERKR